jgi:hypothetical protein
VAEKIDQPHDAALFSYRPGLTIPRTYLEFREEVGRYLAHHEAATIGKGYRLPAEMAESQAMDVLRADRGVNHPVDIFLGRQVLRTVGKRVLACRLDSPEFDRFLTDIELLPGEAFVGVVLWVAVLLPEPPLEAKEPSAALSKLSE